jgi:biopolymer transport protein TolR
MALSANDAFSGAGGGGRRRRYGRNRRSALSEINVTPLVDVMLVLLIVFMISAPLLTYPFPIRSGSTVFPTNGMDTTN